MKKILLLTITLSSAVLFTHAQISKGSVLLGGGLYFNTSKQSTSNYNNSQSSETKSTGISLSPSFGIALKENTIYGINFEFGHTFYASTPDQKSPKSNSYSGGIFLRRYVTLGKGFYLFGQANAYYSKDKQSTVYDSLTSQRLLYRSAGLSLYPGIAYKVSRIMLLEIGLNNLASIYYSNNEQSQKNNGIENRYINKGLSFNSNLNSSGIINVGFRFAINR